jgi:hypothetical protein
MPCYKAVRALINEKPVKAGWNPESGTWSILLDSVASGGIRTAATEVGLEVASVGGSTCVYLQDVGWDKVELATSKFDKFAELLQKHDRGVNSVLASHINQDAVVVRTIKASSFSPPPECVTCEGRKNTECKNFGHKFCPLYIDPSIKTAGYDRDIYKPGYKGRFVIHDHIATKAGHHFDLRLEVPVTSLQKALGGYGGKREKGSKEPQKEYPDKPGTVLRSWAVKKHTLPTSERKLFIVETEDHPISYEFFSGIIPEGHYGAGKVSIYDKGTYEVVSTEGDKKYLFDFQGDKLHGLYALVKYSTGFLWIKAKEKTAQININALDEFSPLRILYSYQLKRLCLDIDRSIIPD